MLPQRQQDTCEKEDLWIEPKPCFNDLSDSPNSLNSLKVLLHTCFYRPQQSCECYVFTCVCLSTRGGGHLPQCMLGYHHPQEQTPPPWSRPPREQNPLEQTPPSPGADNPSWEKTPPGADTPPRSRHHPPCEQTTPWDQSNPPRRDGHFCGRYASYWNAFLFNLSNCRNLCDCRELISKSE